MEFQDFFRFPLEDLPFIVLALILSFTIHEFAHAYSAYKFGDDTAYKEGRVTLNPVAHLDLLGFILILIAGFGWAKPVPVRASRFRKPRTMSIVVSAVGPLSNLLLGIVAIFIYVLLPVTGWLDQASFGVVSAIDKFMTYLISYNFLLFVFNLIPLPPLDGYRIVAELMPLRIRYKMEQNVQWGMLIFLLFVFIPPLRRYTLDPILGLGSSLANEIFAFAMRLL
ncbi:site-2 protease family protein [Paenibacillus sp. LHD-117]|uniref:site-2 protease family protein n=1 Tax=Paenibacillus sp. LHD-117 TaxID=3071412 RepID=UPI0027E1B9D2|nr:site-2 protease family protein [Paenibacillus sp. LHD-117]MDQ6421131.1 site-2 protease family protein [Paenibacillus sp. LHD-117]